jgi:hypothetical protein
MGLVVLPVAFALLLAWVAVAIILAMVPVVLLKPLRFGRVLGPLLGLTVLPLAWYLPNASALSEQDEFDKIAACGLVVFSVAEGVGSVFVESNASYDTESTYESLRTSYAVVDFRRGKTSEGSSDAGALPDISLRYGVRVLETSTDKLVRREEQVVDTTTKTVLATKIDYRPISSPDMSSPLSVAIYHLTYQPTVCKEVKAESTADWLPKVLKPAGGGGQG